MQLGLNFQITGEKQWRLRAPPECWWRCSGAELSATMRPGDVIVVATHWWFHSTEVVGNEVSITLSNEYSGSVKDD